MSHRRVHASWRRVSLVAVAALLASATSLGPRAFAGGAPTAGATAGAGPHASASAIAPADPSLASFSDGIPTGDEAKLSPKPTVAEWKDAPDLRATRAGPRAAGCHVYRIREWVRVSCPDSVTASIAVLGGTATGYSFWIDPAKEGADGKLPAGGEVLFPMKKGDRRVVQMLTFGPGYEGPLTQLPALVIQAHWLEDEPSPVLTLF